MVFQDRTLVCAECGTSFSFSADDQRYHQEKAYTEPKRCPSCRQARRAQRNQRPQGAGPGGAVPREMHPAVCAQCGADTQVPFLPKADRPVYCNDCYSKRRNPSLL